jgi:hypothetical protein
VRASDYGEWRGWLARPTENESTMQMAIYHFIPHHARGGYERELNYARKREMCCSMDKGGKVRKETGGRRQETGNRGGASRKETVLQQVDGGADYWQNGVQLRWNRGTGRVGPLKNHLLGCWAGLSVTSIVPKQRQCRANAERVDRAFYTP